MAFLKKKIFFFASAEKKGCAQQKTKGLNFFNTQRSPFLGSSAHQRKPTPGETETPRHRSAITPTNQSNTHDDLPRIGLHPRHVTDLPTQSHPSIADPTHETPLPADLNISTPRPNAPPPAAI